MAKSRTRNQPRAPAARNPSDAWSKAPVELAQQIFETVSDAVLVTDVDQRIVACNPSAERMYGYTRDELVGRSAAELSADAEPDPGDRLPADGDGWQGEIRFRRKDGTIGYCHAAVVPHRGLDGEPCGFIGFNREISEHEVADESLVRSEEKYRRLVEASTDILASVDPQGCVTLVNPKRVLEGGFDASHIDGRHFTEFLPEGPVRDRGIEVFEELKRGQQQFRYETKALRADGSLIHLYVNATPIRDTSGELVEVIAAAADVTEWKRTEDALRKSRRGLEEAQRVAQIGSWEWDIEANLIFWSDELYRIFGVDRASFEASYEAYLELLHPDDRDRVDGFVRRSLETLEPLRVEHRIVHPDGAVRVVWGYGNVVAENGRPVRMIGTAQDITERKQVEEELRLTRELALGIGEARTVDQALELVLRKVCEKTGWVLGQAWLPSADEACLVCGPAWHSGADGLEQFRQVSETMRFARGEGLPGHTWETKAASWVEDVHDDQRFARADAARAAGIGGGMAVPVLAAASVAAVLEFFAPGPHERDDQLTQLVSPVAAQLGHLLEQERAEQALRNSEARARRVVDTAQEAFISIDAGGRITEWNSQAEATFGWSREETIGKLLSETVVPERYRAAHTRGLVRFRETGEGPMLNKRLELPGLHRDGREFPLELTISPAPSGDSVTFNAFLHDISERRGAEEALRRAHEELQRRSGELVRSNLELEQFAYDASHDLGEPLRVMSALAGRLLTHHGEGLDEEGRRLIASIVDGTERMNLLVNDLLEYSRSAREPLVCRPVDCGVLLAETLDLLSESIAEKRARIAADPLPMVQAHPRQLGQVFQNLLSNALKFSTDRPLRIQIGAQREPGGFRFWVQDNGIGVDPPQADRIFEMFRRLHPRDMYAGTGLGLSICRRIVERHGGRIWVEEAPDEGSVFYFTLPDQPEPEPEPDAGAVAGRDAAALA